MDQLQLFAENEEIAKAATEVEQTALAAPVEPKAKPKRKPLPEHLERIEQVLSVGEDCPECGGDVSKLGEDITEELEYIPGRYALASDRTWQTRARFVGARFGQQVCRSLTALPPVTNLCPRRCRSGPFDNGGLGGEIHSPAGTIG